MSSPVPPAADRRPAAGISDRLHEVLSAAATYLAARWQLLRIETGQAGGLLVRCVVAAVVAVFCAVMGYVALVVGTIAWVGGRWFDGQMTVPILIAAGMHLVLALILGWWLRRKLQGGTFFVATRQEFEEDHQWLIKNQKSSH